jgi:hypothetical protein
MTRSSWIKALSGIGVLAAGGAMFAYSRSASAKAPNSDKESGTAPAKTSTPSQTTPLEWEGLLPLPTAKDVKGSVDANWGATPKDLRALFLLGEEASKIEGAARILATIAKRESAFVVTAHNGDEVDEQAERDATRRAFEARKDKNPPLAFGEAAADFGSGGLFGHSAPYFLWTGVAELGAKAPLLASDPRIMFVPRVATFAALVYLQRILAGYRVDDHGDIKAGWASPSLLVDGRGGETYQAVRERFYADAKELGVDLADTKTIPAKLSATAWPGVQAVFDRVVGTLPTPKSKGKV